MSRESFKLSIKVSSLSTLRFFFESKFCREDLGGQTQIPGKAVSYKEQLSGNLAWREDLETFTTSLCTPTHSSFIHGPVFFNGILSSCPDLILCVAWKISHILAFLPKFRHKHSVFTY